MVRLAAGDLERLLRAARELGEIGTLAAFPERTLEVARRLIDADMATYNRMAVGDHEGVFAADPDFDTGPAEELLGRYAMQNPLVSSFVEHGETSAHTISDHLSTTRYRNSEIYTELYRDYEVEYQMAAVVTGAADLFVGLGFNRRSRDFSARDRTVLDLLAPHVATAHARVAWRDFALRGRGGVTVSLDHARRISEIPPVAERWLRDVTGRSCHLGGRLPPVLDEWVHAHNRASTAPVSPHPLEPLVTGPRDDRLVVRAVPEVAGTVLVLERVGATAGARRLEALGLTPRQAEVLWWLTRGASTAQIARRLGISQTTAATHSSAILRRLDVHSRAEAVRLARDLLEGIPAPR